MLTGNPSSSDAKTITRGRIKLLSILFVCALPMIASYITYFFIKPSGRTNYGYLVEPQRPMPELHVTELSGKQFLLSSLKGKWLMIMAGPADCDESCRERLFYLRQIRTAQGKERERLVRVWLVTDEKPLDTQLIREYDGTQFLRVNPHDLEKWLPKEAVDKADTVQNHLYVVDPLGNLMMFFPKDANPSKVKKDVGRLLRASAIG